MFIPLFAIVVVGGIVAAVLVPKKVKYTGLDIVAIILNILLGIIYVPLSIAGVFTVFFSDNMSAYSPQLQSLLSIAMTVGLSLPFVSVASIALSAIFRRRGKRVLSFCVQFVPLVLFGFILLILIPNF